METFVIYNLKVAVCLAVFYLFYKLLLSRETFHRLNRVLLLGAVAVSFALPLCVITVEREHSEVPLTEMQNIPITVIETAGVETAPVTMQEAEPKSFPWTAVGLGVFAVGAVLTLGWTLRSLIETGRIIRRGRLEPLGGVVVLSRQTDAVTPFSWGRWIVISEADYAENGAEIVAHERAHIRCGHSWDLLATDLLGALQWFNPAMWLLRTELRTLHEYEADEAVLAAGADAKNYQLLLLKKAAGGKWYSVADSLGHSNLKTRIAMMLRKRSSRWAAAKALAVVPLLCIALGAFARTTYVAVPGGGEADSMEMPKGFSGGIAVKPDKEGCWRVMLDGEGDAMLGAVGLIYLGQASAPESDADTVEMHEIADVMVALSSDPDAQAMKLPRPLCLIDGQQAASGAEVSDAVRIAEFVVMDKQRGAEAYGPAGANGVVVITSKRPGEPSAAFAAEAERDTPGRPWFRGQALTGKPGRGVSCSGSWGGGRIMTEEEIRESNKADAEQFMKMPPELTFAGKIAYREVGGGVEFTVYALGDVMMAAGSVLTDVYHNVMNRPELTKVLARLSRSARFSPGLMADPMPLCLVDGKPVNYKNVPQGEGIASLVVYDAVHGAAKFGARGANGVVEIVSTKRVPATLERVDAVIDEANAKGIKIGKMSCMSDETGKLELDAPGYYAGLGVLAGGIPTRESGKMSDAYGRVPLIVVDGVVMPYEEAQMMRPSQMKTADFSGDPEEFARYGADPKEYVGMVKITTISK